MNNLDEVLQAISIGLIVACFLLNTNRILKNIEICKECFVLLKHKAEVKDDILAKLIYKRIYMILSDAYLAINDNTNALKYAGKILLIYCWSEEKLAEYKGSFNLAEMYFYQSKYVKARELLENPLLISKEIGKTKENVSVTYTLEKCMNQLANMKKLENISRNHLRSVQKAVTEKEKPPVTQYQSVGKYEKAREHIEKSITIRREIGKRNGEASCYANLGTLYKSVGEYDKAREHIEKSPTVCSEIGDRSGKASCYEDLGVVYGFAGEEDKANELLEKALTINRDIGDIRGVISCCGNPAIRFFLIGRIPKANEYNQEALFLASKIGWRTEEANF